MASNVAVGQLDTLRGFVAEVSVQAAVVDIWVDAASVLAAQVIGLAASVAVLAPNGIVWIGAGALEKLLGVHWRRIPAALAVLGVEGGCHRVRVEHQG